MEKELPKNWVEDLLGNLVIIERGGSPRPIENFITDSEDGLNWIKISDATASDKYIYKTKQKIKPEGLHKTRYVKEGDFILSNSMSFGRPYIMKTDGCIHDGWLALKEGKVKIFNNDFLYYLLSSSFVFNQFDSLASGSTVRNLNKDLVSSVVVKIPPLAEQNRIVDKLDRLFAQLETIKISMANIPLLLKSFRQQVLTQAVTGKLTDEWRKGRDLTKWEIVSSSKLFEFVTSGSRGWAQYYNQNGKQLFVRITNMNYGTSVLDLNQNKLQFLKLPDSSEGKRTLLKARDILISITADIGMISLIPENFPYEAYVNQHVCLARPVKKISEKFLVNYLISEKGFGQLKDRKKGATKAGLTLGDIKDLSIEIPSMVEQLEIVSRIESLFAKADAIEQQYKALKAKIDTLPQALLHKAFKGELTEQLDSDGDARELLKQIQQLKNNVVKPKKATVKKTKKYAEEDEVLGMVAEPVKFYKK
jgi:type I restriction enzyme S subunit